ncbi:MAG: hypothetical protein PHC92_10725 [Syntrophomonadaceae bacterium]|nr:hypothetical protein [Syntrophomonadaceae bacterium]
MAFENNKEQIDAIARKYADMVKNEITQLNLFVCSVPKLTGDTGGRYCCVTIMIIYRPGKESN